MPGSLIIFASARRRRERESWRHPPTLQVTVSEEPFSPAQA